MFGLNMILYLWFFYYIIFKEYIKKIYMILGYWEYFENFVFKDW